MPAGQQPTRARPVASVSRAVALLDALTGSPDGLGVSELARRIEVNASTASRLLATLERGGLVDREPGGAYRLGLHLVAMADTVLARLDVRELARPRLRMLAAETGESATLSVPAGHEAITVDFVPAESSVVSMARLGRPSVAHATATGKVMLAFGAVGPAALDEPELQRYTPQTIVEGRELAREVEAVRERGWAQAVGEREPDLVGLAAPILGRAARLQAIVGLQGPAARLAAPRREQVVPALLQAAADLSRALGGRTVPR